MNHIDVVDIRVRADQMDAGDDRAAILQVVRAFDREIADFEPGLVIIQVADRRNVAGMLVVSFLPLLFWAANNSFSSFCNCSARPFFCAAS